MRDVLSFFPTSILPFLLLLAACGSPVTEAPPVADSTFVSTLAELHLAEARLRSRRRQDESSPPERQRPDTTRVPLPPAVRDSILARHGTSYGAFRATLEYYVKHPEEYTELYARVVDTLGAEQEALRFGRRGSPSSERPVPKAFRKKEDRD